MYEKPVQLVFEGLIVMVVIIGIEHKWLHHKKKRINNKTFNGVDGSAKSTETEFGSNLDLHFKVNDLRDDGVMFGGLSLQVSHESLVIVALLRQLIKLVLSHVERPL